MSTVSEGIREVINHLDSSGWCQGALLAPNGERCIMGALYAVGTSWWFDGSMLPLMTAISDRIVQHYPQVVYGFENGADSAEFLIIPRYNDEIAKSWPEVRDFLEKVAVDSE